MQTPMTKILLVGADLALLEGLAQSLGSVGFTPIVAQTLLEAREIAAQEPPLVAVVSRAFAAASSGEALSLPLAPGGALVLYRSIGSMVVALPANVQRSVLADLTLPLERNRLVALVHYVRDRVRVTGRGRTSGETEQISRA